MEKDTDKKLMEETVEHWDDIIQRIRGLPIGNDHCPLCKKYSSSVDCSNSCPIKKYTGVDFCGGTSWNIVHGARRNLIDAAIEFRTYLDKLREKKPRRAVTKVVKAVFIGEHCHPDCPSLKKDICSITGIGLYGDLVGRKYRSRTCKVMFGDENGD